MGELDPLRIIDKCGSYQNFLRKYDKDYNDEFNTKQKGFLEFVSTHFASGMRIHELILLNILINSPELSDMWEDVMCKRYGVTIDNYARKSVRAVLSNKFFRGNILSPDFIDKESDTFRLSAELSNELKNDTFKTTLQEIIDFGIYRYHRDYSKNYSGTSFNLYKKYTYRDVCWLLNWNKEEVSLNIGGYKYDKYTKTYPVFINYDKSDDISATTKYEDRFEDQTNLIAISKSQRTLSSDDVDTAVHSKDRGVLMPLFVRKNKDDQTSKEFYFLGTIQHNGHTQEFIMPDTDNIHAVEIGYRLDTPVESNLFEYITERSL